MEFMMERTDNFDRCHDGRQVPWDGGGEQKNREKTYLIAGGFCYLICIIGRGVPVEN